MLKYIFTSIAVLFSAYCFSQHHKFSFDYSYGMAGGSTPTTSPIGNADAINAKQADDLVKYFLESSKLDFKCIYNGCQNRAMVMSLLLKKKGIKHYKIWNFDPFKISIFNKQGALNVDDVLNLKAGKIFWDFHVAIAVVVENGSSSVDTLVIDPSFAKKPIKISDWLGMQNSPNSYYTLLDPIWYNFITLLTGTSLNCNGVSNTLNFPTCFPALLTGDFYSYSPINQQLIAEELATNEQITKVSENIIAKMAATDPGRAGMVSLVSDNFYSFKDILAGRVNVDSTSPFSKYVNEYKKAYAASLAYWSQQLQSL